MCVCVCIIGPQHKMYFLLWIALKRLHATPLLYKRIDELYDPFHNPLYI